jgi:uncharacterized protein with NRDE domain
MCLLVFAHRVRSDFPCVIAANRDEQYGRASAPLQLWADLPQICAGRDLEQGGTWLGATTGGRFAALTNFRSGAPRAGQESRGRVVLDFLRSSEPPGAHLAQLAHVAARYAGFSLIAGSLGQDAYYFSNRGGVPQKLEPGLYGLSNQWLDTPWPKVLRAKQRIGELVMAPELDAEQLCDALLDRDVPPDGELPDTGIGVQAERRLAPCFIAGEHYGTRAVTAVLLGEQRPSVMLERSYGSHGAYLASARQSFVLSTTS